MSGREIGIDTGTSKYILAIDYAPYTSTNMWRCLCSADRILKSKSYKDSWRRSARTVTLRVWLILVIQITVTIPNAKCTLSQGPSMLAFRERSSFATAAMRATLIVVFTVFRLFTLAALAPSFVRSAMINTCLRKY